jgi:hypothetical protein
MAIATETGCDDTRAEVCVTNGGFLNYTKPGACASAKTFLADFRFATVTIGTVAIGCYPKHNTND